MIVRSFTCSQHEQYRYFLLGNSPNHTNVILPDIAILLSIIPIPKDHFSLNFICQGVKDDNISVCYNNDHITSICCYSWMIWISKTCLNFLCILWYHVGASFWRYMSWVMDERSEMDEAEVTCICRTNIEGVSAFTYYVIIYYIIDLMQTVFNWFIIFTKGYKAGISGHCIDHKG